jgi:RNA polymerase sigma-54 factor
MPLELRLQPKLGQQLVITPQLQQAIRLLQLNHLEMAEALREEIAQNPVLEADGLAPAGEWDTLGSGEPAPAEAAELPAEGFCSLRDGFASPKHAVGGAEAQSYESWHARPESLTEHLHGQVNLADATEQERALAHLLVEELDEDGYLDPDAVASVAERTGVAAEAMEEALATLRALDPVGVGARSLRECLLAQARHAARPNELAIRIIDTQLAALSKPSPRALARALRAEPGEVKEAIRVIGQLDPRPGRAWAVSPPHYIVPDLYVSQLGEGQAADFVVTTNDEALPQLKISALYQGAGEQAFDANARTYVQEKLRAAHWLMRSVAMRQKTMCNVMQSILRFQRAFFEQGPEGLRPLILRDVAADVGLHESTISRVTTNKYVHTPRGLFELKFFFNSTIRGCRGSDVASASVRSQIERLIAQENRHAPLSDQKIVDLLRESDVSIARRTVAKYRKMLRKDSSCARKRDF